MKKEKFSIGEKIFLINLQEEGEVSRVINDDLIYVEVSGDEIPVFTSDACHDVPEKVSGKKPEVNSSPVSQVKNFSPEIIEKSNKGIFLSFEPITQAGEISSYNIFIVNDTEFPIDFVYSFFRRDQPFFALKKLLVPYNYLLLHTIEYDLLNETPAVELEVRDVLSKNFRGKMDQKIKPQNFFNKLSSTPILKKENYNYKIVTASLKEKKPEPEKSVTFDPEALKQMMMDIPVMKDNEVEDAVVEIDLHIEVLARDYALLSAGEKLQIQLKSFQQALERAISHNAEKLFVIHGVGSGKLRNEIHHILKSYPEVRSFNNDFHPRYGYGATEINLK